MLCRAVPCPAHPGLGLPEHKRHHSHSPEPTPVPREPSLDLGMLPVLLLWVTSTPVTPLGGHALSLLRGMGECCSLAPSHTLCWLQGLTLALFCFLAGCDPLLHCCQL